MESGTKIAGALLLAAASAGCRDGGGKAVSGQAGDNAQARPALTRMNSLSVGRAEAVAARTATGNTQTRIVSGGATGTQFQSGAGNSQSMNINASGGNVTQRQSGSGNSQSMNIGVVDGAPGQVGAASRSQ